MSNIEDHANQGFQSFREHSADVPLEQKATKKGYQVDAYDTATGEYTVSLPGDLSGAAFWEKDTRAVAAWGFAYPVRVTAQGTILPILDKTLAADQSFAGKTVNVTGGGNNSAIVRSVGEEAPDVDTFGIVLQCPNQDSHEQIFFPTGGGTVSVTYARIRWDADFDGDVSEGELVSFDEETEQWIATETIVWIRAKSAKAVKFNTAGDGTIFEVRKWLDTFSRKETVRPLYYVSRCVEDGGDRITHFKTVRKKNDLTELQGELLSDARFDPPWDNSATARIPTTIAGSAKENIFSVELPKKWDITGPEQWQYLEIDRVDFGFPNRFRPIRPMRNHPIDPVWRSAVTTADVSIADYRGDLP